MARRRPSGPRQYSRTDRMNELVREIVASELERIGDERLELVTITAVRVDRSLERAEVFYSALSAEEDGRMEEVAEALEEQRWKVQQVVNRDVRARRTPQIRFSPDDVLSSALRIEELLDEIGRSSDSSDTDSSDTNDSDTGSSHTDGSLDALGADEADEHNDDD